MLAAAAPARRLNPPLVFLIQLPGGPQAPRHVSRHKVRQHLQGQGARGGASIWEGCAQGMQQEGPVWLFMPLWVPGQPCRSCTCIDGNACSQPPCHPCPLPRPASFCGLTALPSGRASGLLLKGALWMAAKSSSLMQPSSGGPRWSVVPAAAAMPSAATPAAAGPPPLPAAPMSPVSRMTEGSPGLLIQRRLQAGHQQQGRCAGCEMKRPRRRAGRRGRRVALPLALLPAAAACALTRDLHRIMPGGSA